MGKYKILKNFSDKYDQTIKYKAGKIEDFSDERANEILLVDKLIEKIEDETNVIEDEVIEETLDEVEEEATPKKRKSKKTN